MRYHYIPIRMAYYKTTTKKPDNTKCWQLEYSYRISDEKIKQFSYLKNSIAVFFKAKDTFNIQSRNLTPKYLLRVNKIMFVQTLIWMFSDHVYSHRKLETKFPWTDVWIKTWYIHAMKSTLQYKEIDTNTYTSVD